MNQPTKLALAGMGLLFGVSSTTLASTDAEHQATPEKSQQTSYRGHPPFKRSISRVTETAPLARFEEVEAPTESEATTTFRGHPPFKRRATQPVEQADFARFEETGEQVEERRTRRGPVGKWNSRR